MEERKQLSVSDKNGILNELTSDKFELKNGDEMNLQEKVIHKR